MGGGVGGFEDLFLYTLAYIKYIFRNLFNTNVGCVVGNIYITMGVENLSHV